MQPSVCRVCSPGDPRSVRTNGDDFPIRLFGPCQRRGVRNNRVRSVRRANWSDCDDPVPRGVPRLAVRRRRDALKCARPLVALARDREVGCAARVGTQRARNAPSQVLRVARRAAARARARRLARAIAGATRGSVLELRYGRVSAAGAAGARRASLTVFARRQAADDAAIRTAGIGAFAALALHCGAHGSHVSPSSSSAAAAAVAPPPALADCQLGLDSDFAMCVARVVLVDALHASESARGAGLAVLVQKLCGEEWVATLRKQADGAALRVARCVPASHHVPPQTQRRWRGSGRWDSSDRASSAVHGVRGFWFWSSLERRRTSCRTRPPPDSYAALSPEPSAIPPPGSVG